MITERAGKRTVVWRYQQATAGADMQVKLWVEEGLDADDAWLNVEYTITPWRFLGREAQKGVQRVEIKHQEKLWLGGCTVSDMRRLYALAEEFTRYLHTSIGDKVAGTLSEQGVALPWTVMSGQWQYKSVRPEWDDTLALLKKVGL